MIMISVLIVVATTATFYLTSAFIFSTFDIAKWNIEFKGFVGFLNLIICGSLVAGYNATKLKP